MITYSRWNPDGGYDYFQTQGVLALGDDLPVPKLVPVNEIGAPSIESGRAIPPGARPIGRGPKARGLVAPMDAETLRELGEEPGAALCPSGPSWIGAVGWFGLGAALTWAIVKLPRWKRAS